MNAIYNAFAKSLKEVLIEFINRNQASILATASETTGQTQPTKVAIKDLFDNLTPSNSGTGFFINFAGQSVTASHVVNDCIFIELQHKGEVFNAELIHDSQLLDLAVLNVDYSNSHAVTINEQASSNLGKQVFVTGYPLSGILSDYPSLTVGNISSKGGLKGSKGYFQFSAAIQPGNSGGAITDYQGHLMGVVSSTLNQAMMLKQSGTTAQNLNFGIETSMLQRFLNKHEVNYNQGKSDSNFEIASADAVEYSNQILCYK